MTLFELAQGIQILYHYYNDPNSQELIVAEHDQVIFISTDKPLIKKHQEELKKLNWRQLDVWNEEIYDPSASWYFCT